MRAYLGTLNASNVTKSASDCFSENGRCSFPISNSNVIDGWLLSILLEIKIYLDLLLSKLVFYRLVPILSLFMHGR